MTVALAGTGGDEVFGGYPSFVDIPRILRRGRVAAVLRTRAASRGRALDGTVTLGARLASGMSWDALQGGAAADALGQGRRRGPRRPRRRSASTRSPTRCSRARPRPSSPPAPSAQAQQRQQHGLPAEVAADWRQRIDGSEPRHAVSVLELSSFIGERLLRDTDAASMAVGLEVRVPLLDHVLAETAAGIDPGRRFSPAAARSSSCATSPWAGSTPALFDRPKSGFVLPIDTWARRRLQPQMEARLRRRRARRARRPPRRDRADAVALVRRRPARPVLVAHLGHLRAPVVVPRRTTCPWRHDDQRPASRPPPRCSSCRACRSTPRAPAGTCAASPWPTRSSATASTCSCTPWWGARTDYLARRPSGVPGLAGGNRGVRRPRGPWVPGPVRQLSRSALPPVWITAYLRAAAASPREVLLPALLREKLAWCDVVVADFPFVHPIFSAPSGRGRLRVLSTHNLEHQLYDDRSRWRDRWLRAAVRDARARGRRGLRHPGRAAARATGSSSRRTRGCASRSWCPTASTGSASAASRRARARTRQALGIADDVKVFLFTASKYGPNARGLRLPASASPGATRALLAEQRNPHPGGGQRGGGAGPAAGPHRHREGGRRGAVLRRRRRRPQPDVRAVPGPT